MIRILAIIITILFILGCASHENLSEEEKENYRKARIKYEMMQGPC